MKFARSSFFYYLIKCFSFDLLKTKLSKTICMYIPKTRKTSYLNLRQVEIPPFAENVFNKMSTNPDYIELENLYTDLNAKNIILKDALTAGMEGGILLTAAKNVALKEVKDCLNTISNSLDNNAKGNELYILNAGMKLQHKSVRQISNEIPVPANLVANTLLQPRTVELKFELGFVPQQIGVAVEWTPLTTINWTNGTYFGKNVKKGTLTNLPSMTEILVRVKTICENGKSSEWSEEVRVKVL